MGKNETLFNNKCRLCRDEKKRNDELVSFWLFSYLKTQRVTNETSVHLCKLLFDENVHTNTVSELFHVYEVFSEVCVFGPVSSANSLLR